jgi:hypothetical protein
MGLYKNVPYSEVIDLFISASTDNLSIATFDTGTIDFLDANAVNKNYPYIYLRPVSSPGVVDKVRTLTFELYSMDVPTLSDQSPVNLLSACEERIYQLLAWFNRGDKDIQQSYDITITDLSPVNEAFQDRVFGWVATIEVATAWNWNYCDYPKIWPTPTATAIPTATPQPTGTPTPTATGPTPTPTASPTATPTGTPTPTPTATALPTPIPTSTPTPTAAPTFFEFFANSENKSGSLINVCDFSSSAAIPLYTQWFDQDQSWPDRIVGKQLYSDSTLSTVYTGSAIFDGTTNRLASYNNIAAGFEIEWYEGTNKNIVNTAITCSYPIVDAEPVTEPTLYGGVLNGRIENYNGRALDLFGFEYGFTTSSINQIVTGSADGSIFSASVAGTDLNTTIYYRAWARDEQTQFNYYSSILSGSVLTAIAQPFFIDDTVVGDHINLQNAIDDAAVSLNDQCGLIMGSIEGEFYVPGTGSYDSGSFKMENFFDSIIYADSNLTTPANPNILTPLLSRYYVKESGVARANADVNYLIVMKTEPETPSGLVYLTTGSISCDNV